MRRGSSRLAFTLVEVLMVIAIVAVLVGILMPTLSAARRRARLTYCAANLREIHIQLRMYADSQDGALPRGPKPQSEFDFSSSRYATHEVWIGAGSGKPPQYNGLGLVMQTMKTDRDVFYCPADDQLEEADELRNVETDESAYASYLYRQLDQLPASAHRGRLDDLGVNLIGETTLGVETLVLDMNAFGEGPYYHTNHRSDRVNILYQRGDVSTFSDYEGYFALSKESFLTPSRRAQALDQLLTTADFSRHGDPAEAPDVAN